MASTAHSKVSPDDIGGSVEMDNLALDVAASDELLDLPQPAAEEPKNLKKFLKKVTFMDYARKYYDMITYDNAKQSMKWLLESATVNISFTVSSSCSRPPSSCVSLFKLIFRLIFL
jgi:hypothetical protein